MNNNCIFNLNLNIVVVFGMYLLKNIKYILFFGYFLCMVLMYVEFV